MEEENKIESLNEEPTTPVVESLESETEAPIPVEPVTEAVTTPVEPVTEAPVPATEAAPAEPVTTAQEAKTEAPAVEPKKKSKSSAIIFILLIIVVIIFAVWFFVLGGNEMLGLKKAAEEPKQEEKKEDEQEENKIETVELSEEEVTKLINYIPEAIPYSSENDYSAFDSKKVNVSEMDTNWLVYEAMTRVSNKGECTTEQFNLNGLCDFTLKLDDVKESMKNLYGEINIDYPNVVKSNFLWHCTLDGDVYACSNTGGGFAVNEVAVYFKVIESRTLKKYQKAEKDNNNLYVYVKYAKLEMVFDESNTHNLDAKDLTFRVRKYGTGNEVIDETILNGLDYYEESGTPEFYDKIYDQFKDKMTTYKITYKINGNSYNLVSVEPVK